MARPDKGILLGYRKSQGTKTKKQTSYVSAKILSFEIPGNFFRRGRLQRVRDTKKIPEIPRTNFCSAQFGSWNLFLISCPLCMAKKSQLARNDKRAKLIEKYAVKRAALKAAGDSIGLQKLPKNSSPTRYKNRCAITGRSRGYLRDFGLSRIKFRELANEGKIPGVRKSSW